MRVALMTTREGRFSAFLAELEFRGFRIDSYRDSWGLLQAARDGARRWDLVVLDGAGGSVRPVLERLGKLDPRPPCAVISRLDAAAFRTEAEGLEVLSALPALPTSADVEPLLAKLRAAGRLDPDVEAAQVRLDTGRSLHHPHCAACWNRHPFGLGVDFCATGPDRVEGSFSGGKSYEGRPNRLHPGVVSMLLEEAMASCLLARGRDARESGVEVRFLAPAETGAPARVRGRWLGRSGGAHRLQATLEQGGTIRAEARATFLEGAPDPNGPAPRLTRESDHEPA